MLDHCPHCRKVIDQSIKLMPAGNLPPVHCPILILYEGSLLLVKRTGFIAEKTREMEYQPLDPNDKKRGPIGEPVKGRFSWTYP